MTDKEEIERLKAHIDTLNIQLDEAQAARSKLIDINFALKDIVFDLK